MIAVLTGKIIHKSPPTLVIDVRGVGYEVDVPMTTLFDLPEGKEQPVTLHTHFVVREDAQQLYGFITPHDRNLFRQLLKVNGVGARTALAILSTLTSDALISCILHDDVNQLVKVPGIGKKSAERIVLDLKDRLKNWDTHAVGLSGSHSTASSGLSSKSGNQHHQDAIAALMALGYKAQDAEKAVKKVAQPDLPSETVIRLALQSIAA